MPVEEAMGKERVDKHLVGKAGPASPKYPKNTEANARPSTASVIFSVHLRPEQRGFCEFNGA